MYRLEKSTRQATFRWVAKYHPVNQSLDDRAKRRRQDKGDPKLNYVALADKAL